MNDLTNGQPLDRTRLIGHLIFFLMLDISVDLAFHHC